MQVSRQSSYGQALLTSLSNLLAMLHKFLASCMLLCCMNMIAQCDDNEVIFNSYTGNWGPEMSWELYDSDFNELASYDGTEDYSSQSDTLCLEDGCYVLIGYDSWGDGWNDGYLDVIWEDNFLSFILEDGFQAYMQFEINNDPCEMDLLGCTNPDAYNYTPGATVDDGSCVVEVEFMSGKDTRSYIYYEPEDLPAGAPLVFVMHGYTGSAIGIYGYCGMNEVADEFGFAVCYPQGLEDNFGTTHWNAGLNISSVDDLGFLVNLAEYLQETYDLSETCTYACGMSNGGYISYHLACNASETFRAIASVTGTMSLSDWEGCDPTWPVPVLEIHGTADDIVPYLNTEADLGGWFGAGGTPDVIDFWVEVNECNEFEEFEFPDLDGGDGSTVGAKKHSNGINGGQVWLYTVDGGGHDWPGVWGNMDINSSSEIWDFFSQTCEAATDIPEQTNAEIRFWPNPSIAGVYASSNTLGKMNVFTVQGRLISQLQMQPGDTHWIELPGGLYELQFIGSDGSHRTEKVVIR
jgi:polyhydroxybutyrate depolymerase